MRKQITAGLLALSLSFLTSSVIAGTIQVCEEIKSNPAYKGLYGLCNAYWNETDPDARTDILAAFEEKAGPDGPPMPGLVEASCPCWDETHLATASSNGTPSFCQITGTNTGVEQALYEQGGNIAAYTFYVEDGFCFRFDPLSTGAFATELSDEVEASCRSGIHALVELDFGAITCD